MVTSLSQITTSQVCEECVISKQRRNQFSQRNLWRVKMALELIHLDICEQITPHSNGCKDIITFIDDFSRKI